MKKLFFSLAVLFILILSFSNFSYQTAGPGVWTTTLTGTGAIWQRCIAIAPSNPQIMYAGSNTSGIWKSTNGGLNWVQMNSGITSLTLQAVEVSPSDPNFVYCGNGLGGATSGIYVTTNGGANWTFRNTGIADSSGTQEFVIHPTNPNIALVSVWNASNFTNSINGVYKTTDGGVTWAPANTGMGTNKNVICISRNPLNFNTMYCGTSFLVPNPPGTGPTYIYKSYNAGATWTLMSSGLPNLATDLNAVRTISVSNLDTSVAVAGLFQNTTTGGAFFTSNGGTSWTRRSTGIPNVVGVQIRSILIRPGTANQFIAGLDNATTGGVYMSTDAGLTWASFNGGTMLASYVVRSLAWRNSDHTLFAGVAGTSGQGIYEYTFPPLNVGDPNNLPTEYSLEQNYPNPFNPNTVIRFGVPSSSFVTVKVYNSAGREISTIVNEQKTAGWYEVPFTASGIASGVYFYKITAGSFTDTKKMILVK